MSEVHAYLLAGGRGTRLRPLTDPVPKPMLPYLSEPLLCGWLRRLAVAGTRHVHLLIGQDAEPFAEALTMGRRLRLDVTVHHEESPLGSGGALREAAPVGTTPVLVINADVVTGASLTGLLRRHRQAAPAATILAVRHPDPSDFGKLDIQGSRIVGFDEKPDGVVGTAWINGGIYVLDPSVLQWIDASGPCDLERDVFPALASEADVQAATPRTGWADTGTPDRYLQAHRAGLAGEIAWPTPHHLRTLRPGVTVHRDARVHPTAVLKAPVLVAAGADVDAAATVGPMAVVGRSARVGAHATVADAVLLDRAKVDDAAGVSHAVVGPTYIVDLPTTVPTANRAARVA